MKLIELLRDTDIECECEKNISDRLLDELEIFHMTSDSREVKEGSLFVCVQGFRSDGHSYIREAAEKGARAVVVQYGAEYDMSIFRGANAPLRLKSRNTRRAIAFLWNNFYGRPSDKMKLIAVTGTNGKTSVTFMLRAIFSAAMIKTGLIGTVVCYSGDRRLSVRSGDECANMTTPDPGELYKMLAMMAEDGVETVLLEATSHALSLSKLDPLHFDAAVFTNLTPDHLDFHGSMENYLEAKKKLFSMADIAIINGDDRYGKEIAFAAEEGRCRRVRLCSCRDGRQADYTAMNIKSMGEDGSEYILSSVFSVFKLKSPIPGHFTVINTLEAATAALEMGIEPGYIRDGLRHMSGVDGRLERIKLGATPGFSVFIDYAHTPDALENLLRAANGFGKKGSRIVLLFGCGGDRDRGKRAVMGEIASRLADFVVITSDNSRSEDPSDIISDITVGFNYNARAHAVVIEDRKRAIEYVIENALTGDIILLAGKGHEEYEIDKNGRHPFSEKAIVKEAVRKYYCP